MSRQHILIVILALLAGIGLPWSYMDDAMDSRSAQIEEARGALLPLARQAAELRMREATLAAERARVEAVRSRLVSRDPFATIQGELAAAAKSSGVLLGAFSLERGDQVAELPGVVRYSAAVEVSGSRQQYLAFLRLLEEHRLLIELPEVDVKLHPAGQAPEVRVTMPLGFFVSVAP